MIVQNRLNTKPIRVYRSVYSMEELHKIEMDAERGGAEIISITPAFGEILIVCLELDRRKRQF
jgi:hypothetical protein